MNNINVGLVANDGTGDLLRNAFIIVNDNDLELSNRILSATTSISSINSSISSIEGDIISNTGDINSINLNIMSINSSILSQNQIIASQSAVILENDIATYTQQLLNVTLLSGSWTLIGDYYTYTYSNVLIKSSSIVEVIPNNESISIVKAASILPRVESLVGQLEMYAENAPTGNITVTINISR